MEDLINRDELALQIDTEITKLFYLSLLVNRYSKRCVFIHMNGHISNLEISVSNSKTDWNYMPVRCEINYNNSQDYEWNIDSKKRLSYLQDKVEFLERICIEDKIPYEWCNPIERVVAYEF